MIAAVCLFNITLATAIGCAIVAAVWFLFFNID
jgi:hypothetical protein